MLENDLELGAVHGRSRFQIVHFPLLERHGTAAADGPGDTAHCHGQDRFPESVTEGRGDKDAQQRTGDGRQYITDAHGYDIDPAACIADQATEKDAEDHAGNGADKSQQEGIPPAVQDSGENIPSQVVAPHDVLCGGTAVERGIIHEVRIVRRDHGGKDTDQNNETENNEACHGDPVLHHPLEHGEHRIGPFSPSADYGCRFHHFAPFLFLRTPNATYCALRRGSRNAYTKSVTSTTTAAKSARISTQERTTG